MKSMFLWKLILTFTDIDYSLVKRREEEECFALWAVKQNKTIKIKVKKTVKKNQTGLCGRREKIWFTQQLFDGEGACVQKEKKINAILLLAWWKCLVLKCIFTNER